MTLDDARLTRRAVLRGAAAGAAGAAALLHPPAGLARADTRAPGVFSLAVGALRGGETATIAAPGSFSLVGAQWSGPAHAAIELRTRPGPGARWGRWVSASVRGHDPDGAPAGAAQFGEPVWTGPASQVQLRSAAAVSGLRLHFVAVEPAPEAARLAQAAALAQPVLDAGPGQPPIIARAAWARGQAPPRHLPEYGTVKLAFVHHSESSNGYRPEQVPSILRSIFAYHRYVRDFFDIAYNFAIDAFGRIWEARAGGIDQAVIGAHAGGYNAESTGVVVLGSFMALAPPPAALDTLARLLAWKLSLHGVPSLGRVPVRVAVDGASYTPFGAGARVSLPRIAGHRDGDQTSCPGDALYARLPAIRPQAAGLAGAPLRLTIAGPAAPVGSGTSVTLTGRLATVGAGGPVAGAPLELQQIGPRGGETTITALVTDADGAWSADAAVAQNTLLRALHRAAPAAVSDAVAIPVAPALTLTVDSSAPLTVSGTVAPAGPEVTVDLYRVSAGGGRRLVASKRLAAAGGSFRARIRQPPPGRYVLIARTASTGQYVAGASPAVPVTLGAP